MIKNVMNKITGHGATTFTAEAHQQKQKQSVGNNEQKSESANNNVNIGDRSVSAIQSSSSPSKTFKEKFKLSLDDWSFVDGEDAYGDAPYMNDVKRDIRRSLEQKRRTKAEREHSARSSFDDFFYGNRVPRAEQEHRHDQKTEHASADAVRRAQSMDHQNPHQWETQLMREMRSKEMERAHPQAKFGGE